MLFETLTYSPFSIAGIAIAENMVDPKDAVLGAPGAIGIHGRTLALTFVETVTVRTRTYTEAWRARLVRTTPRERVLLGALAASAIVYAPVAAIEARNEAEIAYADSLATRDTARRTRAQAISASSQAARDLAIQDMSAWGFEGTNPSVVRVRVDNALTEAAEDAGMAGVAIETSEPIETTEPVTWVSAQVQADLLWTPTFRFLNEVATWPEGFRITRFAFEKAPPPAFEGAINLTPGRITIGFDFPTRTARVESPAA